MDFVDAMTRTFILCEHPPSTRPPGLAIYARSGMGKTMLVEKFRRTNPPTVDTVGGAETVPVLSISLSSKPSERRVYAQLLSGSGASLRHAMTLVEMEVRALLILKRSISWLMRRSVVIPKRWRRRGCRGRLGSELDAFREARNRAIVR